MRNLVLALIVLGASSCCSFYSVTDLNTCGVVRDYRTVTSPDGDMTYFVEIDPADRFFIHYTTNKRFQIGDTVCFKANGFPIKK
jgi:hypothetical protein